MSIPEISVHELKKLRDDKTEHFILDVRRQDEYELCNLGGHLIPFDQLPSRLHELNPNLKIVIHCHAGGRSSRATSFLVQNGFKNVYNLRGGITAWANEIDTTMVKY